MNDPLNNRQAASGYRMLHTRQNRRIAYHSVDGDAPGILFLGGFRSNMNGVKALSLQNWCVERSRRFLRLDYSGHGLSSGRFEDGCIGDWLEDAEAVLEEVGHGEWILVGSSMGAWIALLLALRRPEHCRALMTLAAATDFTERLLWPRLDEPQKRRLCEQGRVPVWSEYEQAFYPLTARLFEEGRRHLLLDGEIPIDCPVRLLHGMADADVPWQNSIATAERLRANDVEVQLIKNADHRLSEPADLHRICTTLQALMEQSA